MRRAHPPRRLPCRSWGARPRSRRWKGADAGRLDDLSLGAAHVGDQASGREKSGIFSSSWRMAPMGVARTTRSEPASADSRSRSTESTASSAHRSPRGIVLVIVSHDPWGIVQLLEGEAQGRPDQAQSHNRDLFHSCATLSSARRRVAAAPEPTLPTLHRAVVRPLADLTGEAPPGARLVCPPRAWPACWRRSVGDWR